MLVLIFLVGFPILVADFSSLRIPNIYLKLLSVGMVSSVVFEGFGSIKTLCLYFLILGAMYSVGIGMGDIKLLLIIGVILNSSSHLNVFLLFSAIFSCAFIHIVVIYLVGGTFPEKIPMAPSIFAALGGYLAASR